MRPSWGQGQGGAVQLPRRVSGLQAELLSCPRVHQAPRELDRHADLAAMRAGMRKASSPAPSTGFSTGLSKCAAGAEQVGCMRGPAEEAAACVLTC